VKEERREGEAEAEGTEGGRQGKTRRKKQRWMHIEKLYQRRKDARVGIYAMRIYKLCKVYQWIHFGSTASGGEGSFFTDMISAVRGLWQDVHKRVLEY
jgi:hypothetical protein